MDDDLIAQVLTSSKNGGPGKGCRVGQGLDLLRERNESAFETFQHLLGRGDAQHNAIAKAMNQVLERVAQETEVPLTINGATVARHRGEVANPCMCRKVYSWMTS